jgi:hypothetical protein
LKILTFQTTLGDLPGSAQMVEIFTNGKGRRTAPIVVYMTGKKIPVIICNIIVIPNKKPRFQKEFI